MEADLLTSSPLQPHCAYTQTVTNYIRGKAFVEELRAKSNYKLKFSGGDGEVE